MSEVKHSSGPKIDTILIGVAIALLVGVFWYFSSGSQQVLRRSPAGLDGLERWMSTPEGPEIRSFAGGWTQDRSKIGLRILPIYDSDFSERRVPPRTKEELIGQMAEYDQTVRVMTRKAKIVPTLIVLPKWRSGMRLTGLAHPALLLPPTSTQKSLSDLLFQANPVVRYISEPFRDFEVQTGSSSGQKVRLYVPQVFQEKSCEPLIGRADAIILGRCKFPGAPKSEVLVLSDPDLINNHGLRLGDNAHIIRDILLAETKDKTILIDYSTSIWLFERQEGIKRERTWDDLKQFFAYPFSLLWISAGLLMALVLWRAGLRYGPLLQAPNAIGASKQVANSARARLMRLTGQDGALLRDYTTTRLAALAAQQLGPAAARDPGAALKFLRRKRPDLADRLEAEIAEINALPANHPTALAIGHVDTFEHILEQLDHDT